jgi:hypothetical protein
VFALLTMPPLSRGVGNVESARTCLKSAEKSSWGNFFGGEEQIKGPEQLMW